jgi:ABC-type uncharacterized transport system substrate-binding protein
MKKTTLTLLSALLVTTALASCGKGVKKVGILQFGSFDALTKAKDGFIAGLSEAGFNRWEQHPNKDSEPRSGFGLE